MEMIADRSSAVLDVESDVKLCNIKVAPRVISAYLSVITQSNRSSRFN